MPRTRCGRGARGARERSTAREIRLQEHDQAADPRDLEQTVDPARPGRPRPSRSANYSQTGPSWSRTEARIADGRGGDQLPDAARNGGRCSLPLPPGVRFDGGQGLLRGWDRAATPRLEFEDFNLGAMAVERVVIEAAPGAAPDAEGRIAVLRKRYEGASCARWRGCCSTATIASSRSSSRCSAPASPSAPTDRETALRPHPPYSVLAQCDDALALPHSDGGAAGPYPLPLRLSRRHRLRAAADRRAAGDRRGRASVGRRHLPGLRPRPARATRPRWPTRCGRPRWLQSDHPRLRAIAAPFARHARSPRRRRWSCSRCGAPADPRVDFAGHFSALETLARRAGDCTEAAVLLAALGRAARHPDPGRQRPRLFARALSRRRQRLHAAQLGAGLCRRANGSSFDLGARAVRQHPYRAHRRRRRRALDRGRQPAGQPAANGRR